MIIPRTIEDDLKKRLEKADGTQKVIILYGARQVGKTTLVKQLIQNSAQSSEYFNCGYLDIQSLFS